MLPGYIIAKVISGMGKLRIPREVEIAGLDYEMMESAKVDEKAVKAVNDVSFELFEGETLGLVGESGSGKSTIAKIITGLVKPSFGELEYNGLSLYNSRRKYQIDKLI